MLGQDLLICNSSGTALIAAAKSCEVEAECELIETSSPTSGTARTYIPGRTSWRIIVNYLVSAPTVDLANVGGQAVTVQVKVRNGSASSGSAFFQTCRITGTVGNLTKGSFILVGTGPLS
jgi:hypothetical protein